MIASVFKDLVYETSVEPYSQTVEGHALDMRMDTLPFGI